MTKDMMARRGLLEKSGGSDVLREMIGVAAERLMELAAGTHTGVVPGEKNPARLARRNGYRDRPWETRAGTVERRLPRLRTGSSFASFPAPRRMAETALTAVIREAYIQGVSTRSVDDLVTSLGMTGIIRPTRSNGSTARSSDEPRSRASFQPSDPSPGRSAPCCRNKTMSGPSGDPDT